MIKELLIIVVLIISSNVFARNKISKLGLTKSDFKSINLNMTNQSFNKQDLSDKMNNVASYVRRRRDGDHSAYRQYNRISPSLTIEYPGE